MACLAKPRSNDYLNLYSNLNFENSLWGSEIRLLSHKNTCHKHCPAKLSDVSHKYSMSHVLHIRVCCALSFSGYVFMSQWISWSIYPYPLGIIHGHWGNRPTWWRHQMETFSALLAVCAGNAPVPGAFPVQMPVTRSFDVFFNLHPNKRLNKQWWGRWF